MGIALGWVAVAVLAVAAFVAVQRWSNAEESDWIDARGEVAAENAGRLGTGGRLDPGPEKPFVVAHPNVAAIGAAVAVAVIGSVVVLLATIAARLPDRST